MQDEQIPNYLCYIHPSFFICVRKQSRGGRESAKLRPDGNHASRPFLWKSGPSLGISINHTAEGAAPPWRGWEPRRLWR